MKKYFLFVILFLLNTFLIYPQDLKMVINFNGNWKFQFDRYKLGKTKKWFENTKQENLMNIKVPDFWEETLGKEYDGWGWYFNTFTINDRNDKIAIKFDGVDDNATVWVNGKLVGSHQGFSESFYFDITDYVIDGENTLAILVEDTGGPGGINKPITVTKYKNLEDLYKSKYSDLTARNSEDWVKNGIIYELYPRAFSKEGNLNAIIPKLENLKDLGITIIWLMPINPIGNKNRKGELGSPYSVKDYYGLNPELGTKEDFKNFVEACHKMNFKVIVDVVLNHSAWDNDLITEHPEFYTKNKEGKIISPNVDWYDVADFNFDNYKLRTYLIDMLKYWIKEFDIDGYRCDVSELVPTDFWEAARIELELIKPIFILSEGSLPEHHMLAFDMTYSWNVYDILHNILDGKRDPNLIFDLLKAEKYNFPYNSLRMRFNENHDKKRAAKIFGTDGALITAALVNTIPGVPLIYNGQEVGDTLFASLFDKTEINWESPKKEQFFDLYKRLNELRKNNSALTDGNIKSLNLSNGLLGFIRSDQKKNVFTLFNFSQQVHKLDLSIFSNVLKASAFNLEKAIYRKVKINSERMGRPAAKDIEIEPLGFLILEY